MLYLSYVTIKIQHFSYVIWCVWLWHTYSSLGYISMAGNMWNQFLKELLHRSLISRCYRLLHGQMYSAWIYGSAFGKQIEHLALNSHSSSFCWKTFKFSHSTTIRVRKFTHTKMLMLSMTYAWGLPLFILVFGITIDSIDSISDDLKPGIGTRSTI